MRAFDAFVWGFGGLAGACGLLLVLASHPPAGWSGLRPAPGPEPPPDTLAPETATRIRPTPPPTLPDVYKDHVGSRHEFSVAEIEGHFGLSYGFIDHLGRTQRIYCEVSRRDHERESARYGYDKDEIRAALHALLQDYGPEDAQRMRERLEVGLFRQHGLTLENHIWGPDYEQLATRARPLLDDCFRALARAGREYNERQLLGLFVAFLQEIEYQLPPEVIGRRQTAGVWVPTEVLIGNHGDCDSKATAFAALWLNAGSPLLLIDLPHHMLVGVEVRPGPGEKYVLVNNRYFVLCEVAGPGKFHPGSASHNTLTAIAGHFDYKLVAAPAPRTD